jgi:hypothetical protein
VLSGGDVLAEHVLVELRGPGCLAVEVAGVLAAAAPLGTPHIGRGLR